MSVVTSFHSLGGGDGEARLSRSQRGRHIAVASSVGERWRYLGPAVPRRARERPTGDVCARARRQSAIPPHAVRLPELGLKLIACRRLRVYDPMVTRSSHASSHFLPSVFNRVRVHIEPMQPRDRRYVVSSTLSRDAGAGKAHTQCLWRDRPQRRAPTRRPASRSLLSCGQPSRLSRPFCSFVLPSLLATSTGGAPGATPRRREATVTAVKEELYPS